MPRTPPAATALRSFLTLLVLALAGCEEGRQSDRGPRSAGTGEPARPPAPDMEAQGVFFSGQIEVETLLSSRGFAHRGGGEKTDDAASSGEGRRGGGGGYGGGGKRGRGGAGSGERSTTPTADSDGPTPHIRVSNEPPVSLHLRLTNHGSAPVEVEVVDFNSDLGNFVVQPSKILLPPDAPVEAEPMISRLGVNAGEIPLTVNLQLAGHREKQVLTLRLVPPPAASPSAAPPAPP